MLCFFNTTENSLQLQDKEESNYILLDVHYHCLAGELNKQTLPRIAVEVRAPSPARGEANIAGGCSLLSQGGGCMGCGCRTLRCSAMWSHSPAWKQKQKKRASFFKTEKRNRLFIDPRWYRFLASLALWNAVTSANYWDNSLFFHVHVYISLP